MAKFDSRQAIAYLQTKWQNRPCPLCGVGNWNVQDSTYQLTEFNQGTMVLGGPLIPVIPVVCGNCGNRVLVNAIIAGILKTEAPPNERSPRFTSHRASMC